MQHDYDQCWASLWFFLYIIVNFLAVRNLTWFSLTFNSSLLPINSCLYLKLETEQQGFIGGGRPIVIRSWINEGSILRVDPDIRIKESPDSELVRWKAAKSLTSRVLVHMSTPLFGNNLNHIIYHIFRGYLLLFWGKSYRNEFDTPQMGIYLWFDL